MYSTHKHRPEKPRLRLLLPLSRSVSPEEYEAASRKIAEHIGLAYFDSTTFQPSRLMYWPSCSRDGEYVFRYHDGPSLNPDTVLQEYEDWRDISQWPTCPDEVRIEKRHADKQQDPTKKENLVGVFCRTYTVPEAISKFLPDVYTPTEKGDRYTYTAGSTYGGLVIYDNGLFCFSNHATDPAHGMDLNAFDLVRTHLFGKDDENEEIPVTKRPSWAEMTKLVDTDGECKKTIAADRKQRIEQIFAGEFGVSDGDDSWRERLEIKKGVVVASVINLQLILLHDENLQSVRYNSLRQTIVAAPTMPKGIWERKDNAEEWNGADDAGLFTYLSNKYQKFNRSDIQDVLIQAAMKRRFHPIWEYFSQLPPWDGQKRAESIFIRYLGAEDGAYVRGVTRKWHLGAVTRLYQPGVKFDWCITLTGDQGIGKSTMAKKLGVSDEWFTDSLSFDDMRDEKAAGEKLRGQWIMEIGEMKGLRKTDVESVKSFLSRSIDKYRPAYGKHVETFRRSCVFIGTGNNADFLTDPTGNRRFWPVHCRRKQHDTTPGAWDLTPEEAGQIWAEVKTWYDAGEGLELSREDRELAEKSQAEATEQDDRAGIVAVYLDTLLPDNWSEMDLDARRVWLADTDNQNGSVLRGEVTVMEVWAECFRKNPADKRRSDSDDITRMLRQLGWVNDGIRKRTPIYGQQRVFRKEERS